jgi:hypothetical protein
MRRNALSLSALVLILTLAMLPIAQAAGPAAATVAGTNNKLRDPFAYDTTLTARDPLRWPFSQESIWNTPIGSRAKYVPADLETPERRAHSAGWPHTC